MSTPAINRELSITRTIAASPSTVFDAWTNHLPEWWGPTGSTTPVSELELKPGGKFRTVMRLPDGQEFDNTGVFLEVTPERIVFTDAYTPGWEPVTEPFFTGIFTFEPNGTGTQLTAYARHWTDAAAQKHEEMGFFSGWGQMLDRLQEVAEALK